MLQLAANLPSATFVERPPTAKQLARLEKRRVSSLAVSKGAPKPPLRMLPWTEFVLALEHKRDLAVRGHIRWCMRTAIRNCETLRRAGGRSFELRPGGRGNMVASGSLYHEGARGIERMHSGNDARVILNNGRYLDELDDNLRKLACPVWAIPVVKRAVRAKLALDWDLEGWNLDEEAA